MAKAGEISSADRLAGLLKFWKWERPIYYQIAVRKAKEGDTGAARQWMNKAETAYGDSDDGASAKLLKTKAAAQAAVGNLAEARKTADRIQNPHMQALAYRDILLLEGNRKSAEMRDWSGLALYYPKAVSSPFEKGRDVLLDLGKYIEMAEGLKPGDASEIFSRAAVHLGMGLKRIKLKVSFWKDQWPEE